MRIVRKELVKTFWLGLRLPEQGKVWGNGVTEKLIIQGIGQSGR